MRIAIVGAGFCGLATAWFLADKGSKVVVFDAFEIGKGASGIATGLLHAFAGAHAKLNWRAAEGLAATQELLALAEQALGFSIAKRTGMFRPAITSQQASDFALCAKKYPEEARQLSAQESTQLFDGLAPFPGIFIETCWVVDSEKYLKGLEIACRAKGVIFEQQKLTSLTLLKDFERIIVTSGAATIQLPELSHLPLTSIKGQVLEFAWPTNRPPLPCPINSHAYIVMHPRKNSCLVGATFEREFRNADPDPQKALDDLLPKVRAFLPDLNASQLVGCQAGLRASTPDHRPILARFSPTGWVLTGMGSKGLLYHALFAKELVNQVLSLSL